MKDSFRKWKVICIKKENFILYKYTFYRAVIQLNGKLFEQQQLSLCLPFLPAGFLVNGIVGYRIVIRFFWLHIFFSLPLLHVIKNTPEQ